MLKKLVSSFYHIPVVNPLLSIVIVPLCSPTPESTTVLFPFCRQFTVKLNKIVVTERVTTSNVTKENPYCPAMTTPCPMLPPIFLRETSLLALCTFSESWRKNSLTKMAVAVAPYQEDFFEISLMLFIFRDTEKEGLFGASVHEK
jgi:hypothetical protein